MYRLHFEMNSAITGNLKANTFFGLFCNAYKDINGNDELEELLDKLYKKECYLVFSNPLQVGTTNFLEYKRVQSYHSSINRDTLTAQNLYTVDNKCIDNFDVLVYTDLDIEKYLDEMKILDIGARKNKGCGNIKSISIVKEDNSDKKIKKVLSDFIPDKDTPKLVKADYYVRRGVTIDNKVQKPMIIFKAGVNLQTDKNIIGRIVKDEGTGTYFNGMSVVV